MQHTPVDMNKKCLNIYSKLYPQHRETFSVAVFQGTRYRMIRTEANLCEMINWREKEHHLQPINLGAPSVCRQAWLQTRFNQHNWCLHKTYSIYSRYKYNLELHIVLLYASNECQLKIKRLRSKIPTATPWLSILGIHIKSQKFKF